MIILTNIHQLCVTGEFSGPVSGAQMSELPLIENAYLKIDDGIITDYGSMTNLVATDSHKIIDVSNRIVLPCWCDSHTHLVYAQTRYKEFVDRINGLSYEEIAARGGGILNSAHKLRDMSEENLLKAATKRLEALIKLGTGAIEIKSGYGLSLDAERKMLRVIAALKKKFDIPIKATLLAAHAIPKEFNDNKSGYVDFIIKKMMPAFVKEGLCDFVDIFCEKGYFSIDDMEKMITAAASYNLEAKVHLNQFNALGGIKKAVALKARSVDHLEQLDDEDIDALKEGSTIATALPGCSYFLNLPYTPARKLISNNIALAIATDYNPGSAPSGNMNFTVSQACINLRMTPAEAILAATINGAFAMNVHHKVGSITKGKLANILVTEPLSSFEELPYHFGTHVIESVFIKGVKYHAT